MKLVIALWWEESETALDTELEIESDRELREKLLVTSLGQPCARDAIDIRIGDSSGGGTSEPSPPRSA